MFKKLSLFLFIVLVSFCGCGIATGQPVPSVTAQSGAEIPTQNRIKISTSCYPIFDFAKKIGGELVEVTNIAPFGSDPHEWEPSPTDIAKLRDADLFLYSGAGFEPWTTSVVPTLPEGKPLVVEAAKDLELINADVEDPGTAHADGQDPHVWLNPKNAALQMAAIANALVQLDPANAAVYQQNYKDMAEQCDKLDKTFADTLLPLPNKTIVVTHAAYSYLCKDYGITQLEVMGFSPDAEPSLGQMAVLTNKIKEENIKYIFFESNASSKIADAIAKETGVGILTLNSMEGVSVEAIEEGKDYFSMMEENLQALKTALE